MRTSSFMLTALMVLAAAGARPSPGLHVIPEPKRTEARQGEFLLTPETRIVVEGHADGLGFVADFLGSRLRRATGFPFGQGGAAPNAIVLRVSPPSAAAGPAEGYSLVCGRTGVTISAEHAAGVFYGVQTLLQLLPAQVLADTAATGVRWAVPHGEIADAPRFAWRGMHLDVGRHFFPAAFVKRYIDLLAAYKMNTFHWHLTEDQGWRIQIMKYSRLTDVGSQRAETMGDGTPHGGFYTQQEIRDVVEYARQRFITVVPEIEMPGHSLAALAAYPELSCTGGPFGVGTEWGVIEDVFCAGNEKTFEFLEGVIDETVSLFPGPFVHIGGDECPKVRWKNCEKCQARMKAEGLAGEQELQSYFLKRIGRMLAARGKRMVGWDEILEGGLAPNATVMSWRGIEGGIAAARSGHDVVMTPTSHCYFDYFQGAEGESAAIGGLLPLEQVYAFEPVPAVLSDEEAKHVLGAQGNLWTEWIPTTSQAEYMLLPRMLAMSEVLWSDGSRRDYDGFMRRLGSHFDRFVVQGLQFRVPTPLGVGGRKIIFRNEEVAIDPPVPGGRVYYTLDGTEPTPRSREYAAPVPVGDGTVLRAVAVLPNGRVSKPVTTTYWRVDGATNGLRYSYYEGTWDSLPEFSRLVPDTAGTVYDIGLGQIPHREDAFAVVLEGVLRIPQDGDYTLFLSSDDGSRLFLDSRLLIDHNGLHGAAEKTAALRLGAGKHTLRIEQFERGGAQSLGLSLEGPGVPKQPVPPSLLTRR